MLAGAVEVEASGCLRSVVDVAKVTSTSERWIGGSTEYKSARMSWTLFWACADLRRDVEDRDRSVIASTYLHI